jgi:preprotein translocase subunit SecA
MHYNFLCLKRKTGEGKSIVLGLTSTLIALLNYRVDVVCYSKILSDRDSSDFKALLEELSLQNDVQYGTFVDISNKLINKNGDIRQICK